jgi:hypothetical protein
MDWYMPLKLEKETSHTIGVAIFRPVNRNY